jgi:hypothetical protein
VKEKYQVNNIMTINIEQQPSLPLDHVGYCYHCVDCDQHFVLQHSAVEHSKTKQHGVVQTLRSKCDYKK